MLWLVGQLPEDSAYSASCKGGREHRAWPADTVLLAGIFNALQNANWQRGGKGKRPRPIEPPAITRTQRRAGGGRARAADRIRRGIARAKAVVAPETSAGPPT